MSDSPLATALTAENLQHASLQAQALRVELR